MMIGRKVKMAKTSRFGVTNSQPSGPSFSRAWAARIGRSGRLITEAEEPADQPRDDTGGQCPAGLVGLRLTAKRYFLAAVASRR